MDLLDQVYAVWQRRVLILIAAVSVAITVFIWRQADPEVYEATATVQVRLPASNSSDPGPEIEYHTGTVSALASNRSVMQRAAVAADQDVDLSDVSEIVTAETRSEAGFVEVSTQAPTAAGATSLANRLVESIATTVALDQSEDLSAERTALRNALADVAQRRDELADEEVLQRAALQRESEALNQALSSSASQAAWVLDVVEAADEPSSPIAPNPTRDAVLVFLLALLLFAELIVIRRAWRSDLSLRRTVGDAAEASGVPEDRIAVGDDASAVARLFPTLRDSAQFTVLHCGSRPDARVASACAEYVAGMSDRVLLADVNPNRPSVHRQYGVSADPGLTDLELTADPNVEVARLRHRTPSSLEVVTAGEGSVRDGVRGWKALVGSTIHDRTVAAISVDGIEDALPAMGDLPGTVVVTMNRSEATRRRLEADISLLGSMNVDVAGLVITERRDRVKTSPLAESEESDTSETSEKKDSAGATT